MRYAKIDSDYFCGIDLHARTMYVCVMSKMGEIVFQRNLKTTSNSYCRCWKLTSVASPSGWSQPSTGTGWLTDVTRPEFHSTWDTPCI